MSVRTTLLNIDRTSVQISVINKEDSRTKKKGYPVKVVELYLADDRPLKTGIEREICKQVLRTKKYGKPLLAIDGETGKMLGIMTVDEYMAEGGQGPYCRHGYRSIPISLRKVLEKIIKEYKIGK